MKLRNVLVVFLIFLNAGWLGYAYPQLMAQKNARSTGQDKLKGSGKPGVGYIIGDKAYTFNEKSNYYEYYIELFPNSIFKGSLYTYATGSSNQTCYLSESPEVDWLYADPDTFTVFPNNLAEQINFYFNAPSETGFYTTKIMDLNNVWDDIDIFLTVTNNPSDPVKLKSFDVLLNEQHITSDYTYCQKIFDFGGAVFYLDSMECTYEIESADWLTISPSYFKIDTGESINVDFITKLSQTGLHNTYVTKKRDYSIEPTYFYMDVYCANSQPDLDIFGYNYPSGYSSLPEGPVKFQISSYIYVQSIADQGNLSPVIGGTSVGNTWLCSVSNVNQLVELSIDDGNRTLIGTTGIEMNGLAYDQTTGLLFGVSNDMGCALYTIDIENAVATKVGSASPDIHLESLGCDFGGNLYSVDVNTDEFGSIDKANGQFNPVGAIGIESEGIQDMEFDPVTGRCYFTVWNANDNHGELRLINKETGMSYLHSEFNDGVRISGLSISEHISRIDESGKSNVNRIEIIPNPFSNNTTIYLKNPYHLPIELTIYSLGGKKVYEKGNIKSEKIEFDRGDLPNGIYIIQISGNKSIHGKIIIR